MWMVDPGVPAPPQVAPLRNAGASRKGGISAAETTAKRVRRRESESGIVVVIRIKD